MIDKGPTGRVEKIQQTLTERREEERTSRVEIEDNLFDRNITHFTKVKVEEG